MCVHRFAAYRAYRVEADHFHISPNSATRECIVKFVREPAITIDSMQQTLNPLTLSQPMGRILDAPAPVRLWHLLSLDAPTVAAAWSLGFAKAAGVRLPAWVPLLLALVTWVVYIGDRLLDARTALRTEQVHQLRQRHLFHWQHRRGIFPLALAPPPA